MKTKILFPITVLAIAATATAFFHHGRSRSESRVSVPFELSKSGHQVVTVVVNGRPLRLMLDTGSAGNLLSADAAGRLGLKTSAGTSRVSGLGSGDYRTNRIESPLIVDVAGVRFEVRDVAALDLIFAADPSGDEIFDGLLGSPFFRTHRATIDFASRRLVFDATA